MSTNLQIAQPSSSKQASTETREVPLDRLLEPVNAARETFDETALEELMGSIATFGILQNLVVEIEGEYFRIHAGHRRFTAAKALGMETAPCKIYQAGECSGEAVKEAENAFREDLNPAEQAVHFTRLLELRCEGDTDKLAQLVGRTRTFVEERLNLLRGDSIVLEALRHKQISIGAAVELNRMKDQGIRLSLLDAAVRGGASARVVRSWRLDHEKLARLTNIENLPDVIPTPRGPGTSDFGLVCWFCKGDKHPYLMRMLYLHEHCQEAMENLLPVGGGDPHHRD